MPADVSPWVRIGLAVIALPQLITGLWAVLAPSNWYDNFPGVGPSLVAAEPPLNSHLATDAGAGFLATGVALLAAALVARRSGVYIALLAYLVFAAVHFIYHVSHRAPNLSDEAHLANVLLLASGVVAAAVLAYGARSTRGTERTVRPVTHEATGTAPPPSS